MKEIKIKFDEYYEQISNKLNEKIFSSHNIVKEIVKSLFYESKEKGLNTKEILAILDIAKDMILKFKLSMPENF